jgi:hypothetical protein
LARWIPRVTNKSARKAYNGNGNVDVDVAALNDFVNCRSCRERFSGHLATGAPKWAGPRIAAT